MLTIGTMLSGGEGVGVGARAAGLRHLWGVEADARIAGVAQANGFHAIVAKIQDMDPSTLEIPDVLHASPECQRASQARQADEGGRESPLDIEIGAAVCNYLRVMSPKIFTLENVWGYRNFTAFEGICTALNSLGYFYHYANVNAADFGVPQTRRRLILRAVRGGLLPELPAPEPWIGWYQAIEDLIPGLPESQFAPWQLARLPDALNGSEIFSNQESNDHKGGSYGVPHRRSTEPALTITGMSAGWHKAFILGSGGNTNFGEAYPGRGVRYEAEPMHAITKGDGATFPRAFVNGIWQCGGCGHTWEGQVKPLECPSCGSDDIGWSNAIKAFLVESKNANQQFGDGLRSANEPATTVVTDHKASHQPRAFIVGGQFAQPANGDGVTRTAQQVDEAEPVFCVTAVNKGDWRAWLSQGRVVKMTPRCLARFQSFPDSYVLPDNNALACRVIGNAVPPLLYQKIIAQLVR